ncbi:MAG: hypothetical protein IH991_22745, partial [Planctomycetes bacterium]|nr:hypothetical protein [Planctomycetota bacterium]
MRPLTAVVVVLAVAAPWFILVGLRTDGDYLSGFFVKEHLGRATTAMENHGGPIFFYPAAILVGFFPWSVFAIPVIIGVVARVRRNDAWKLGYVFAACWVCVFVGVFSLAKTKLPSYVTPCYPALALLTGCFVHHWCRGKSVVSQIWPRLSMAALALVGVAVLIGIPIVARKYLPGHEWLAAIGLVPLLGSVVCFALIHSGRRHLAGPAFAGMAILFTTSLFGFVTGQVDKHQQSQLLFDEIARRSSEPRIGSVGCLESSWVFYTGQTIWELHPSRPGQAHVFLDTRTKPWKPKPRTDIQTFLANSPDAFIITTKDRLDSLKPYLPRDVVVLAAVPYFLKNQQLVLLGRQDATHTAERKSQSSRKR